MNKPKVLVVDNNPVVLKVISMILEATDCELRTAEDGLEALDVINEFKPDIVFTDLVMPKIDGGKLCYIIRHTPKLKDIFLVIISGIGLEDDLQLSELDADVYIVKGPAVAMKEHILFALESYHNQDRKNFRDMKGVTGLSSREITRELLSTIRHNEIVLDRMNEGVVELDREGRVVMVNRSALSIMNTPEAQLLSGRFSDFISGAARNQVIYWLESLTNDDMSPLEFDYNAAIDIAGHAVTLYLVPVLEDKKFFIVGILQDVTERKCIQERQQYIEKELLRVQKLDAISMMASGITHDFNNLLSVVKGNVEMARMKLENNDLIDNLLGDSIKAIDSTIALIQKFTTFSDNYLPAKSPVKIKEVLSKAFDEKFSGSDLAIQFIAKNDLWHVDVDSGQIVQVFLNIVQNAYEAMNGNGTVSVHIANIEGNKERETTGQPLQDGKFIKISIKDTGVGIPDEIKNRVFDPYFSTKSKGYQKGMGLGLTIVHSIIRKHGGLVWIDTDMTKGCCVHFYLPAGSWTENIIPVSEEKTERKRVLIMDDDDMMRIICKKLFAYLNCDVDIADEGLKAVTLFSHAIETGNPYDLVVLDLHVNSGMDGIEAASQLYSKNPDVCMIAISGDSLDPVMENYRKYHFVAALPKPFTLDMVEALFNRLFRN